MSSGKGHLSCAEVKWHHRLPVRLSILLSLFGILIFGVTLGYNYCQARRVIVAKTEVLARNMVAAAAGKLSKVTSSVMATTESMGRSLETAPLSDAQLRTFIGSSVLSHPDIFGSTVAFEPSSQSPSQPAYAPYYYRTPQGTGFVDLNDNYDYVLADWYQIPRELGQSEWSEPYHDEGGGEVLMATYSVPFYRTRDGERRFAGIVTADISLEHLTEIVSSMQILETGYGFLLSRNGVFLAHPRSELIMDESVFSLAEERDDPKLREIGRRMAAGEAGFMPYRTIDGISSWTYCAPLENVGWTLGVIFPEHEILADIRALMLTMAGMGVAGILVLMVAVVFISSTVTAPIRALAAASDKVAAGDFAAPLPERRLQDEVGALTQDFLVMQDSLKDHIQKLMETTAAQERMESELKIAHDIQMSILPKTFPPFPARDEFDLYAHIAPAKEVGGDFYDFFPLGKDLLCFVIGDVSGKGVPAALFMAVTKTLIKSVAKDDVTPDAILAHVNRELAADNDACMFVTLFCGVFNMKSGEIQYANAGHNPPLLVKQNGAVKWLPRSGALVAGAMPEVQYKREKLLLTPGESLYMYTDGVSEAMNPAGDLYSEPRLEKTLSELAGEDVTDIIHKVTDSVHQFADGASQSDDITMMMIRYLG